MDSKENFESYDSWVDLVMDRAERCASRSAYIFLPNGVPGHDERRIDFQSLARRAKAIGAALAQQGVTGARVPLIFPPGLEFIEAFLGVMFAGATPVPMRSPGPGKNTEFLLRIERVLDDLDTGFLAADQQTASILASDIDRDVSYLDTANVADEMADYWHPPALGPEDLAFIQYTSGSTREPKGVCISHQNLMANCQAFTAAGFYEPGGFHVGWMPHYHDMGLVGSILAAMYGRFTAVLMAPQSFLRDPMRWLRAISHYRASSSGGPNFAYKLVTQRVASKGTDGLDLSCWTSAYCGAEPIQADVLSSFAETLAPAGFSEASFLPCYGMAEATLFLTGRKGLRLSQHETQNADNSRGSAPRAPVVSLGRPADSTEIRILGPEAEPLPEGRIGEILIEGPGISPGYFGAAASEDSLGRPSGSAISRLRTGDLGFFEDGELYVCGRAKDLIIVRGQNLYPQDVEQIAETALGELSASSTAAFASQTGEPGAAEETFVVLAGVRNPGKSQLEPADILKLVRESIVERLEVVPATLALVPAREIPKTSSGKIQRSACARKWRAGEFTVLHQLEDQAPVERHAIYPLLQQSLESYENRNTKYQFDLEHDIEWHRIREPGRYFTDELISSARIDPDVLKARPDVLAFYEWAYALLKVEEFIALEEVVIEWGDRIIDDDTRSRSSALLVEEERKHVALFQRYSRALKEMRPDDVEEVLGLQRIHQDTLLGALLDRENYTSERQFHYSIWLSILYFEEYTIWLDQMLPRDDADYQPTWLQAHFYHRREESQHVITDHAYIKAMDTTYEERMNWSEALITRIFESTTAEYQGLLRLTERRFPELQGQLALGSEGNLSYLTRFLGHRAFSRTRDSAPYAEIIAAKRKTASPSSAQLPAQEDFRNWLRSCLSLLTKTLPGPDIDVEPFPDQGLDSLGHISLVAEIESKYGIDIGLDAPYLNNTIDKLLTHLYARKESPTDSIDDRLPNCTTLNPDSTKPPLFWVYDSKFIPALIERMPSDQTVHIFHHEGVDLGPVEYRTIGSLAEHYADLILEACRGRRKTVHIAGYSMGGLVAYEVARRLEQSELQVEKLILVSPATPPSLINPSRTSETGASYWRYRLGRIMRQTPAEIRHHLDVRIRTLRAQWHFKWKGRLPPDLLWAYLRPFYGKAIRAHIIEPYEGETLLIGEQGFPIERWQTVLKGKRRIPPLLPCPHDGFKDPEMLDAWIPELIAEFS